MLLLLQDTKSAPQDGSSGNTRCCDIFQNLGISGKIKGVVIIQANLTNQHKSSSLLPHEVMPAMEGMRCYCFIRLLTQIPKMIPVGISSHVKLSKS